ncbi:hypothetical protein [Halobaculum sp. D14]|uniref:hypothetical protein n=1 Tax=Halobaculum sp. D14 TaxID=3421642 RepID=UPI003EBE01B5
MSYELHEPEFDGTTTERWKPASPSDLGDSALDSPADHFLLSESGFPPESPDDLALQVVDRVGRLNRNALANAAYGADSVETMDVDDSTEESVQTLCRELLREEFESMPETEQGVDEQLLAWEERLYEQKHETRQKLHTDDEQRYHEAEAADAPNEEERPETGR